MAEQSAPAYTWTTPFYGVTHLNEAPQTFQITATEFSPDFAECVVIPVRGNRAAHSEPKYFDTIGAAKSWGECVARSLNSIAAGYDDLPAVIRNAGTTGVTV